MRTALRQVRPAVLAALLALAPAIAPRLAGAQDKEHKSKGHKEKDDNGRRRDRVRANDDNRYQMATARDTRSIPPGQRPPSGLCRIWIEGVPPGRQPAPTDCAAAERNRPSNGRVIYGSTSTGEVDSRRNDRGRVERPRDDRPSTGTVFRGTWPAFHDAEAFYSGTRPASVRALVPGASRVEISNPVNGIRTVAKFYDANGQLLEVWRDVNADGRTDRITEYRNGRVTADYTR
jgi:hypothetical protein